MKTQFISLRSATILLLLMTFIFGQNLLAQDEPATIFFEISKLKDTNGDLMSIEDQVMLPYVQERIKQGNQLAHVLFRVIYPHSDNMEYDYVAMDVFGDFNHLYLGEKKMMEIAKTVWPDSDLSQIIKRFEANSANTGTEVFRIRAEAFPGPVGASDKKARFIQANYMKVSPGNSDKYVDMESEVFMPIHQARGEAGTMHDWILLSRVMPYGSEWGNNFITFDVYNEWGDMAAGNMNKMFEKVHPGKDADAVWDKMTELRELTRSETWELVSVVNKPAQEVVYDIVKEGSGPAPMRGQEVAYKGKIMNTEGETIIGSESLGFNFYHTIGSDIYNPHFDKGLLQMKKGGIMNMTLPPEAQDKGMKDMLGGKTGVLKVELVDISDAKPDGAAMLKRKIKGHGLSTAKAKYQKLQSDNPKGYVFREDKMNLLGYHLLEEGMTDAAIYVFEQNTKRYPKSWNACDSLADGYRAAGNYAKAKHCYKMALAINPDFKAAKEKLAQL